MFDRTYIAPGPSSVSVRVEEKRAPTDESVRLLREMEEKARASVVESMRLTSAGVEVVAQRYDDHSSLRTFIGIHYKVNGKQRSCKVEMDYKQPLHGQHETVWKALADDLAVFLVSEIGHIGRV